MKVKALVAVKTKLFRPCKKLNQIFKFKLRKSFFIRSLRSRSFPTTKRSKPQKSPSRTRISALLPSFRPPKQWKKMEKLAEEHRSVSENPECDQALFSSPITPVLFPSPITPDYVKACRLSKRDEVEDVEDACRSFENYLVEMVVEEGKVGDLTDVEELLYCWKNLKCPVFIDLVCRFYGELCKDLFFPEDDEDHTNLQTQPK